MANTITIAALYAKLRANGFSDAAARGIIANAVYESGPATSTGLTGSSQLNADALGDGGASHGLLQWNVATGGYTSQAGASVDSQIGYMKKTLPQSCLKLGSASAVAGCLAQHFENCTGCQPGGSQYNSRVAAANTIAGLKLAPGATGTTSGGTSSAGTGLGGGGAGATTTAKTSGQQQQSSATCTPVIQFAGIFGSVGQTTFLNKCQVRQMVGVGLLVAGGTVMLAGLFLIMKDSAAGTAVGNAGKAGAGAIAGGISVFMPEAAPEILTAEKAGPERQPIAAIPRQRQSSG